MRENPLGWIDEYWTVHGNFSFPPRVRFFTQEEAVAFAEKTIEDEWVTDISVEHTKTVWRRSKRFLNADITPEVKED